MKKAAKWTAIGLGGLFLIGAIGAAVDPPESDTAKADQPEAVEQAAKSKPKGPSEAEQRAQAREDRAAAREKAARAAARKKAERAAAREKAKNERIVALSRRGIRLENDIVRLSQRGVDAANAMDATTVCSEVLPQLQIKLPELDQLIKNLDRAGAASVHLDKLREAYASQQAGLKVTEDACASIG